MAQRHMELAHTDSTAAALGWLVRNLDHFAGAEKLSGPGSKPLLELIVLMVYRLRSGPPCADEHSRMIVDRLVALAKSPTVRQRHIGDRNQVVLRAGLCAILGLSAVADHAHHAVVQRAVDTGMLGQAERLPHHVMIERTILDWGHFTHDLPDLAHLVATSMLPRHLDALYQSTRSAYEFTHNVMFGTGLGEYAIADMPSSQRDSLRRFLGDLLVRFDLAGHWDLLGELLLCWDCLKFEHDEVYEKAWCALRNAQDVDGSVIATRSSSEPDLDEGSPDGERRFADRYHTTLVFVFAATAQSRLKPVGGAPSTHVAPRFSATSYASTTAVDAGWLIDLVHRCEESRAAAVALSALVGLTLLSARDPQLAPMVGDVVDLIEDRIRDVRDLVTLPATLTLVGYGMLHARGAEIPAALVGFVHAMQAAVSGPAPDDATALAWYEKRLLLSRYGMAPAPVRPHPEAVWAAAADADIPDLPKLWQLAGACSGYGVAPVSRRGSSPVALDRMEALGIDALRRHDLINGCALLRSTHLLRPIHRDRIRSVVTFLSAQQGPAGGYGYVDPAIPEAMPKTDLIGIDVEVDVQLPVSLAVWWALTELTTEFRLFAHQPCARTSPHMDARL